MSQPSAETLAHLATLIGFPSISHRSNRDLIDWAAGELHAAGATTRLSFNAERTKANLFATFPGQDSEDGGLVLSGHSDVVPVDGQDWASDPFRADIRDGRLYGRGACDMKGFLAAALARAPALAAAGLRRPLHLAFSYDEELGCLGISALLDDLREAGIRPAACIVGEPTSMRLVSAHKGGASWSCRVCGRAAHSSLAPQAVNAVEYAGRLIGFIADLAAEFRAHGPFDRAFDVPHPTISTNLIDGGTAGNIVPAACRLQFEYRVLPGMDGEAIIARIRDHAAAHLLPAMRAIDPAADIVFENIARIPPLAPDEASAVFTAACAVLGTNAGGAVAFGSEAGSFQANAIPTILCGPGSIEQAHKADEFVPLAELAACERFLDAMVTRLAG
jgi:acetylornithine deacetylase